MIVTAVVPIRSFDGLSRLAGKLDGTERAALMRRLAERTTRAAADAGAAVVVVTGDSEVTAWASGRRFHLVAEPDPPGLNAAAAAGVGAATGPWLVIHADLPAVTAADVERAAKLVADGGSVLAPSHDGGTSLIGGTGEFPFSYGVGSFRRHVARAPDAAVLARPGLALDLDRGRDLSALAALAIL